MNAANLASDPELVAFREIEEQDRPYVFATWLDNFAMSRTAKSIERPLYFFEQKKVIERLVKRGSIIAVDPAHPGESILGWIVREGIVRIFDDEGRPCRKQSFAIVHYLFVRKHFRRMGLGAELMRRASAGADRVFFTHLPPEYGARGDASNRGLDARDVIAKLAPAALYNPYLAFPRSE